MKRINMRVIVDEGISEEVYSHFLSFLNKKGYENLSIFLIAKDHPGMPDTQIIYHLLNKNTIFLTSDSVLHNTVLSHALKSYYVNQGHFTGTPLKGIPVNKNQIINKHDLVIKDTYLIPETDIRPYVLPSSEKRLRELRIKRRRIRSYFGGQDHIGHVAVTVSWKEYKAFTIIGLKFKISSNIGIKAIDGTESYIRQQIPSQYRNIAALNEALILSIQLMLHHVKTCIYYDSPKINLSPEALLNNPQNPYDQLFITLYQRFPCIEFIHSTKGRFIEGMRRKLDVVLTQNSNEIIESNIPTILKNIHCLHHGNGDTKLQ
jgi:hypothetical protein